MPRVAWTGARTIFRKILKGLSRPGTLASVTRQWDQLASDEFVQDLGRISWTGIPQVHLNHNFLVTGDRDAYWVDWLRERYFSDGLAGDALSLGCGAGHLDRIFKSRGYTFRSFTGIDVSPRAVARARTMADQVGLAPSIEYRAADLNSYELPTRRFDFIYFFMSLHHIEALEHVLQQCQRALRPRGLLLVNEFVGPSRFQWTERQLDMANTALASIPSALRRDLAKGGLKTTVERPTVEHMIRTDPSESVRSAEIERLVKDHFAVVGEWNWGGTLNHLVFQNIAGNFDPARADHRGIVERLIHHENTVIAAGLLPSDFKVFLARPQG
jgi:SAM-dependent methyltransferase